jgi:DNA gyrase subunit A
MHHPRPDLSKADPEIVAYIEYLEAELEGKDGRLPSVKASPESALVEPSEPPTTVNIITANAQGWVKRTPRHLYTRQRRAGMGVFDLEAPDGFPPNLLVAADESQRLLLLTNHARGFHVPVNRLKQADVHARGENIFERIPLELGETLAAILPAPSTGFLALVSQTGMVRTFRHHIFGDYMKPGTSFFNYNQFGPLVAACWTPGDSDLFIATRQGTAIRFSEKLVPPQGIPGIRLSSGDEVSAVTSVYPENGVYLLSSDGHGTIRQMSGFSANKSAGGGGKAAIKTDQRLVAAITVTSKDDLFILSELGKIIRFSASEVPETEGVIQGVICMTLRGDACTVATRSEHAS